MSWDKPANTVTGGFKPSKFHDPETGASMTIARELALYPSPLHMVAFLCILLPDMLMPAALL